MASASLKPGDLAPFFSHLAAGSGRRVSLRTCAGRPLVLIFHGREDSGAVREINHTVRLAHPSPAELTVASVIDLSFVPPVYWAVANVELDRAYREAAREITPDADPKDYVSILPDWTGSTTRKYRVRRGGPTVVVVRPDSLLRGICAGNGADLGAQTVEIVSGI